MEFGLFSNDRRPTRRLGEAWDLDIAEIVVADEAGFREAWLSEHQAPAELIIAKAAPQTKRIRLGSAVRPLAYYHPFQVALEANAADQLTNGRYMLGVGFGFYPKNMEWRGLDFAKTREMMHASIELILKLWNANEPVDYDGPFWKGTQMVLQAEPVQKPHPPVAIAANNSISTPQLGGRLGLMVLTSDFISAERLRRFGDAMVEAQVAAGRAAQRSMLRACRVVYVAETDREAREDMRESYESVIAWEIVNTPHHQVERIPPGGTLQDITYDGLVDNGNLIIGSPDTVAEKIRRLYDETGGFGVLNFHCGRDYATPEKVHRSMRLFMREVAPKLRHLDPDAPAKPGSLQAAE
jgi:alkanesulfonate monooxygenase SsuD/methylene tetrahydromethanopterin reductase-like flavin-dependent oxidoreductase (luciferase family)